jgi:hypothetical protein
MVVNAEETAQSHIIKMRPLVRAILPNPMMGPELPNIDRDGGFDLSAFKMADREELAAQRPRGRKPYGWRFVVARKGMLGTLFDRFVSYGDIRTVLRKIDAKQISSGLPDGARFLGQTAFLTNTSKMGCYSWNLPAGPEAHGGSCPGAQLAFYLDPDGADKTRSIEAAIRRSRSHAAEQLRAEVPDVHEAVRRFVCNGCYALKGCYGNPTMIVVMEWRRMWLMDWALPRRTFIPTMIAAIKLSARDSRKDMRKAGTDPFALASSTHPDYFRIHDAGDYINEEYFDSWLEICERLPSINFWSPTRIWAHGHMAAVLEDRIRRGKIPKNLALRPSGLFFDAPGPTINGVAGGASSNIVSFHVGRGKIKTTIKGATGDAWVCPAYLPSIVGGGALPARMTLATAAKPLGEDRKKRLLDFMAQFGAVVPGKGTLYDKVKAGAKTLNAQQRELVINYARLLADEQADQGKRKPNPRQQSFAMYPPYDAATPSNKDDVFYDGVYDPRKRQFVIDSSTGRPLQATGKTLANHPGTVAVKVQQFQAAGACAVARDPNHASACRVCWGTTNNRRTDRMRSLPIVYSKH